MNWRNHKTHREETKAVKQALARRGIKAKVGHGKGTGWAWLEINLGDPKHRNGLIIDQFGLGRYTKKERHFQDKVLLIAQEITGRHGDYSGEILILSQD